jgi:hypothetical protein
MARRSAEPLSEMSMRHAARCQCCTAPKSRSDRSLRVMNRRDASLESCLRYPRKLPRLHAAVAAEKGLFRPIDDVGDMSVVTPIATSRWAAMRHFSGWRSEIQCTNRRPRSFVVPPNTLLRREVSIATNQESRWLRSVRRPGIEDYAPPAEFDVGFPAGRSQRRRSSPVAPRSALPAGRTSSGFAKPN